MSTPARVDLNIFGTVELTDAAGTSIQPVLAQPKRLALLAYLAASQPLRFHRRDTLLALLWPVLDADHARDALNKALHFLRRSLGSDIIESRGDAEVRLVPERAAIDVADFARALREGRLADALPLYRGPLMDGFHISGAPEFERWLDTERAHWAGAALRCARTLAKTAQTAGNLREAEAFARRALGLSPADESCAGQLIEILVAGGDRAGALRVYEDFSRLLKAEYELLPSAEIRALVEVIRTQPSDTSSAVVARTLQREPPGVPSQSSGELTPSRVRARWRRHSVFVAAAVAVAVLAPVASSSRDHMKAIPERAIAVLPFTAIGNDTMTAMLSDALTMGVMSDLGSVPGFLVPGYTTTTYYARRRAPAESLGKWLGVTWLLEGAVEQAGDQLRVRVHLVETATGFQRWSKRLDRSATNWLTIEHEVVNAVLAELEPGSFRFASTDPKPPRRVSPRAEHLYLLGHNAMRKANLRKELEYFEAAIQEEPRFANALGSLSLTYANPSVRSIVPESLAKARSRELASRALEIDSTLPSAHTALGNVAFLYEWDWAGALRSYERALSHNPNHIGAYLYYGQLLAAVGRHAEAQEVARRLLRLEPGGGGVQASVSLMFYHGRKLDEAIKHGRLGVEMEPTNANARLFLSRSLLASHRYAELAKVLRQWALLTSRIDPATAERLGHQMGDRRRIAEARRILDGLTEATAPGGGTGLARFYAQVGDTARALELLEEAYRLRAAGLYSIRVDPLLEPLHASARFQDIVRGMKLR